MLYPSIDKLLNLVDSKYMLVHVASKRSKQMLDNKHFQMKENEYVNKKELGRALEEVEKGLKQFGNLKGSIRTKNWPKIFAKKLPKFSVPFGKA